MEPKSEPIQKRGLPLTTIAITLIASMVLAAIVAQAVSSKPEPGQAKDISGERYDALAGQLARIEQRIMKLESETTFKFTPISESGLSIDVGDAQVMYLLERLSRLEELEREKQETARVEAE